MTSSKADKYRGHSDPTVTALALELTEAEQDLDGAAKARSQTALVLNNLRGEEERAQTRVNRLVDALAVLAGDPGVRVERSGSAR